MKKVRGRLFRNMFKELKDKIIKEDYYHECKTYCKGCCQCEFWIKFNAIATDLMILESEEDSQLEQSNEKENKE